MHRMVRPCALAAALLGGICWVAHLFVGGVELWWAGSVLLVVAGFACGALTARLPWVGVVAGLGSAGLGWALVALARSLGDVRLVEGVVGAGAALLVGIAVAVTGSLDPEPHPGPHRGNHRA